MAALRSVTTARVSRPRDRRRPDRRGLRRYPGHRPDHPDYCLGLRAGRRHLASSTVVNRVPETASSTSFGYRELCAGKAFALPRSLAGRILSSGKSAILVEMSIVQSRPVTTQLGGITGRGFQPGHSGNPGGARKGSPGVYESSWATTVTQSLPSCTR